MSSSGRGIPRDDAEALKWLWLAAEQGYATGQYYLGGIYQIGRGVPKSDVEAAKWYRKAAGKGTRRRSRP